MPELIIATEVIPYTERQSSRAKKMILSVRQDRVAVTYPPGVSKKKLREFVQQNQAWIIERVQAYRKLVESYRKKLIDGESLPCGGRELTLRIIRYNRRMIKIKRDENTLWVFLPDVLDEADIPANIRAGILLWYKDQAREVFADKLTTYAQAMKVTFGQFRVKEQKSCWGSCSANGNLNLNWKILLAPEEVMDYLLIHELAHLRHLNHSAEFWQMVEAFCPDYKTSRKWLKCNGKALEI